ncbi:MAG: rhodanese-like domain-containing protein [Acidimicrobiales bacterium]
MDVPEIDVPELAERRADGAFVLDVRQPEEYTGGHVPGAVLVPLAEVPDRVAELPTDAPVLIICRTGARSHRAAQYLRPLGIDAINVRGGTMAWMQAGHGVVTGSEPG